MTAVTPLRPDHWEIMIMTRALRKLSHMQLFIGFARALDLFGHLNEPIPDPGTADQQMRRDWEAVGQDFRAATRDYDRELISTR